jgi:replicative DNA helicase
MNTLKTRIEKIETTMRAGDNDDWFEIVKEQGVERALVTLAERGMTTELETLRGRLAEAQVKALEWERAMFPFLEHA